MTDSTEQRLAVERALMERARANAMRQVEQPPRRVLQHAIALALALAVVAVVMLGFDRFLTSMQKFMGLEIAEPPPGPAEPMPAYVVPAAPHGTDAAPNGGATSQPPDSRATPTGG